jgi:hypothetical protein
LIDRLKSYCISVRTCKVVSSRSQPAVRTVSSSSCREALASVSISSAGQSVTSPMSMSGGSSAALVPTIKDSCVVCTPVLRSRLIFLRLQLREKNLMRLRRLRHLPYYITSVAEPHHFYAAPAPAAPAPTLFYSKAKFLKRTEV